MPISVSCPACGRSCQVPEERRDQLVACAACGVEFLARSAEPPADGEATPRPDDSLQSTRVVALGDNPPPPSPFVGGEPGPASAEPITSVGVSGEPQKSVILGDFHLTKKLGEGAMGTVYRARQVSLDREVALKVLFKHVARNPRSLERFCREARTMARLEHPNIVRGFAVGEAGGRHYFAMELVDGGSVQKWLTRLGKFSVGDALYITLACARALQYAHERGLVHRDVKPDNILITKSGQVKLSDLGMVKVGDDEMDLTQTGFGIGTPCYMPLEQARSGKDADARSDIYALGCVLYCLLTGQPPFLGATLVELIEAKELGSFKPARRSNPEVPERLDLIIHKMVAKLPAHRYQTCAEAIRDLESLGLASKELTLSKAGKSSPGSSTHLDTDTAFPGIPGLPAKKKDETTWWYIRFKNRRGQKVQKRMKEEEVLELISDPEFDLTAQGSREPDTGYRSLATFREFESILVPRVTRAGADKRLNKVRSLVEKLSSEEERRPARGDNPREKVPEPPSLREILLDLPMAGLGRLLLFLQERSEKGLVANLGLLLLGVGGLAGLIYLFYVLFWR